MFKKLFFALTIYGLNQANSQNFIQKEVDMESGYTKDVFYNFADDNSTKINGDNWDLAFSTGGASANILFNSGRGSVLYLTNFTETDWNTIVDTTSLSTMIKVYNSNESWQTGAFNKESDPNNSVDLGWGVYDMNTHHINGNKVYIANINSNYYKIYIKHLISGKYNFKYQQLTPNSTLNEVEIAKADYSSKYYGYYSIEDETALDNEPNKEDWDLLFTKYTEFIPTAYNVTGVFTNPNSEIIEVETTNPQGIVYNNLTFTSVKNTIGYDWKTFNMSNMSYDVNTNKNYILKDKNGIITHFYFTDFEGTSTGKIEFELYSPNIKTEEYNVNNTNIYSFNHSVLIQSENTIKNIVVSDNMGRIISKRNNVNNKTLDISIENSGLYFISITYTESNIESNHKIIIK